MVFKLTPCIVLCENVTQPNNSAPLRAKTPSEFLAKQPFCTTNKRYIIHSNLSSEIFCSSIKDIIHILTQYNILGFDLKTLNMPSDPKSFRDFRARVLQKIRFFFTTSILLRLLQTPSGVSSEESLACASLML